MADEDGIVGYGAYIGYIYAGPHIFFKIMGEVTDGILQMLEKGRPWFQDE